MVVVKDKWCDVSRSINKDVHVNTPHHMIFKHMFVNHVTYQIYMNPRTVLSNKSSGLSPVLRNGPPQD